MLTGIWLYVSRRPQSRSYPRINRPINRRTGVYDSLNESGATWKEHVSMQEAVTWQI